MKETTGEVGPSRRRELSTWGEIATHLGQSVRNVQRWEELGLPIHRLPGKKARVFAYSDELDQWKAGPAPPAPLLPENPVSPHPAAAPRKSFSWPPWGKWWIVGSAALTLVSLYAWAGKHRPLADYRVFGSSLIMMDDHGRELWRHTFAMPLIEVAYDQPGRRRLGWIGELVPHDGGDLVFQAALLNAASAGSIVYCFGRDGLQKWQFVPGRSVMDGRGSHMIPPFYPNGVEVIQGKSPENTRIAVASNHYMEQAEQVAFLDVNGRVTGEYWHPGHLLAQAQAELDGRPVLLLGGVNNGEHRGTMVVLDPLKVVGLMTPRHLTDSRFGLLNMAEAKEEAVVLFPRSCISKGQPYNRLKSLRVTPYRVIAESAEGPAGTEPGFAYQFDHSFQLVSVLPCGPNVGERHRELEKAHQLDHAFSADEEEPALQAGVVIRRNAGGPATPDLRMVASKSQ